MNNDYHVYAQHSSSVTPIFNSFAFFIATFGSFISSANARNILSHSLGFVCFRISSSISFEWAEAWVYLWDGIG